MEESQKFRIVRIHICNFEKTGKDYKLDINQFPDRICVIDEEKEVAIDVEMKHQYPYVRTKSMLYLLNEAEKGKIVIGKRAACIEYTLLPYLELDTEIINECRNIIAQLKQGVKFPDGNEKLTNEEYLKIINTPKEEKKTSKVRKKRK